MATTISHSSGCVNRVIQGEKTMVSLDAYDEYARQHKAQLIKTTRTSRDLRVLNRSSQKTKQNSLFFVSWFNQLLSSASRRGVEQASGKLKEDQRLTTG
jgi:hypothetical protein